MALYDAFISYSHAEDKPVAAALQTVVQKLGKPWYHRRALRIFRDDTSLAATPELWPAIENALGQSRYLIVLASPQFAASRWCGMEVSHWLQHKSLDTLLIALTAGELAWDGAAGDFVWDDATPLPPVLKGKFRSEPKWIDLRPHRERPNARDARFTDAGADLAAAVHGLPKEDLLSQEVRQQRRALALAWSAAALLLVLASGAGWQWWEADAARRAALAAERAAAEQRVLAERQRDRAVRNFYNAKNAVDMMLFRIAQSLSSAPGMRVETTRRILELAESMFEELAKDAPEDRTLQRSRAAILAEFANVYLRAGDLVRARAAAEGSVAAARKLVETAPGDPFARRFHESDLSVSLEKVGDVRRAAGDIKGALAAYEESLAIKRRHVAEMPGNAFFERTLGVSLGLVGELMHENGDREGVRSAFQERLAIMRRLAASEPRDLDVQRDLSDALDGVGLMSSEEADHQGALAAYEESLVIRRRLLAADPENTSLQYALGETLLGVGDLHMQANDRGRARAAHEENLAIMRHLVASDPGRVGWRHQLSIMLERLGDIRLAEGDKAAALALFEECLAVRRKLFEAGPDQTGTQLHLAIGLFKVGTAAGPARARAVLEEAVPLIEKMAREGRLTGAQHEWPEHFRATLSKLPPAEDG